MFIKTLFNVHIDSIFGTVVLAITRIEIVDTSELNIFEA